jgi:adenine specific DNA methylase Mod
VAQNALYYGDNLDILRRYIDDESIDLVYLAPPFNSAQNYNVLFASQDGNRSAAQIHAFEDTWQWDRMAAHAYQELVEAGGQTSLVMQAFRQAIGENDMLAYLSMMAPRLIELRRALKDSGDDRTLRIPRKARPPRKGAGQKRLDFWRRSRPVGQCHLS